MACRLLILVAVLMLSGAANAQDAAPPTVKDTDAMLSSWNDTAAKAGIIDFVTSVTDEGSPDYLPPKQRLAVFDNDGTLWSEKPYYFQFYFAMDLAREMAEADPDWASTPMLEAAIAGDVDTILAGGNDSVFEVVMATHSGMTVEAFQARARDWLNETRHPETGRLYREMVFQPMIELLDYLRANDFAVYIVSGGGQDFIRTFAEEAYGVPPENVIGSRTELAYEEIGGRVDVVKKPEMAFLDDVHFKPVGIMTHLGQRPVMAGGNSDGDLAMAQWTLDGAGPGLAIIVHHTDAGREFAYDRDSASGRLDKTLAMQGEPGWIFVDMAQDWARIWPE